MKKKIIQTVDQKQLKVVVVNVDLTISKNQLIVTQSNPLATSIQEMTLQEKRLLLLAMSYIRQSDEDFMLYRIPITEIQKHLELDKTTSYGRIEEIATKLLTRVVKIKNDKGDWEAFQWLSYCRYFTQESSDTGEACLEIRFHDYLRFFLLNLKKHFGSMRLLQIAAMPSFNSIRIGEILFHSSNNFRKMELEFSVDDLKTRLAVSGKYKNFNDFRKRILEPAQRDCAAYFPLTFTWTEEKRGRKIIGLRFKIAENTKFKKQSLPSLKDLSESGIFEELIADTLTNEQATALILLTENGVNKTTAESLIKELSPARIIANVKLVRDKHKHGKIKNLGGITVTAIRDDWSNKNDTQEPLTPPLGNKTQRLSGKGHQCQEQEQLEALKKAFDEARKRRVEEVMASWDDKTREAELAEFRRATNRVVRTQYLKMGLNSQLVKSSLIVYIANKHLSAIENDFMKWAKEKGHEIEGNEIKGYLQCSTKHIGSVLEKIMPHIDNSSRDEH